MPFRNIVPLAAGLLSLMACVSCSASNYEPVETPPINVEGVYRSAETVGPLGRLSMELRLRPEAVRVYRATLDSEDNPEFAESIGVGTLGNDHLILNFDIRAEGDYFFQGSVENTGTAIDAITGTFLFPGQAEQLPVVFEYSGVLPPLEEEE